MKQTLKNMKRVLRRLGHTTPEVSNIFLLCFFPAPILIPFTSSFLTFPPLSFMQFYLVLSVHLAGTVPPSVRF